MKLILFNLSGMIRRYKSSLALNIIGMSIAFASFVMIMMQVNYDMQYDAFHPKVDQLYRIDVKMGDYYSSHIPAPLGYEFVKSNPDVEAVCWYNPLDNLNIHTQEMGKDNAISIRNLRTDKSLFSMFDFQTISGNLDQVDDLKNIAISEKIALKFFKTPNATGQILFDGETPLTVVAVFKNFPHNSFLKKAEIVRLNKKDSPALSNMSNWNYPFFIQLRKGVDPEVIAQDATKKILESNFLGNRKVKLGNDLMKLTPIDDIHFDTTVKYDSFEKANYKTTITLISIALVILLIASINFINFATALVPQRIRNINTQKVLGSTVGILRLSLIIEAIIISLIAFCISLLMISFINSTSIPSLISASTNISDNLTLIAILGGVSLLTGLVAGIYPAYYTTSFAPALILKGSFGLSPRGRKLRTALIGFQFLISFIFVSSAILIHIQNQYMKNHDVGFNRENIFNVYVSNKVAEKPSAFRDILMQNPNIKGLTFGSGSVINYGKMNWGRGFKDGSINFACYPVSTEFIDVMGLQIVEGRNFMASDSLNVEGTFIFNETAARAFGIKVGDRLNGHREAAEVVGIVKDFNFQPMHYAIQPICLYVMGTEPWYYPSLAHIRVSGNISSAKEYIEKSLRSVAPDMKEIDVFLMEDDIERLYTKDDNLAKLITIFSMIAIAISIIGVFGIVMFDSRYRRKEIAIRKVHGSTITQILTMFGKYYIYMVAICFVISVPIVYYFISQWLVNFAYHTQIHWWVFAISMALITLVTVITVVIECLRAATENPIKSINAE